MISIHSHIFMACRLFQIIIVGFFISICTTLDPEVLSSSETTVPTNLIVINVDQLGWGDVGLYTPWRDDTPNIDKLVKTGVVLDNLYCETSVSASSAAFLAGRLGVAWGLYSSNNVESSQLQKDSGFVLPNDLRLLSKILNGKGHKTKFIGRWNLGQRPEANPINFGFDEFMGTVSDTPLEESDGLLFPDIGFYQNENIVARIPRDLNILGPGISNLTMLYTEEAKVFIINNGNVPFYLHLSLEALKHESYRSRGFVGSSSNSRNNNFTDALREVDNLVKEVVTTLESQGLTDKTVVIFAAHSTALSSHFGGGSNGPFSGTTETSSEGGVRVPGVISYPGHSAKSRRTKLLMNFADLHATALSLMGISPPPCNDSRCITDGKDLSAALSSTADAPNRTTIAIYRGRTLMAIRMGRYKAHRIIKPYAGSPILASLGYIESDLPKPPLLFDVVTDPAEKFPVGPIYSNSSGRFPDVMPAVIEEIAYVMDTVELSGGLLNECSVEWLEWAPPGCGDMGYLCNPNKPTEGELRMCHKPLWG